VSWNDYVAKMKNLDIASFANVQLANGRENGIKGHWLYFRVNGKRRFGVEIRQPHGLVWQTGRFENDIDFWKNRLIDQAGVLPVNRDQALRFYLRTAEDCSRF